MSSLVIGPLKERLEFQIAQAELIANTTQNIVCPVDGFIDGIDVTVNTAITTGGTITLQGGGAVWNMQNYLDTSSFDLPAQGDTAYLPPIATLTPQLFTASAPTALGYVNLNSHGLAVGQPVTLGGTLPTGFSAGTYYVSANGYGINNFNLSSSIANALAGVSITGSGSNSTTATVTTGAQGIIPVTNCAITVASSAAAGTIYIGTPVPAGDATNLVKAGQLLKLVPASFATAGEVSGFIRFRSNR